ncbi:hypothetical protein ES705_11902 [subsurface metagenome]
MILVGILLGIMVGLYIAYQASREHEREHREMSPEEHRRFYEAEAKKLKEITDELEVQKLEDTYPDDDYDYTKKQNKSKSSEKLENELHQLFKTKPYEEDEDIEDDLIDT